MSEREELAAETLQQLERLLEAAATAKTQADLQSALTVVGMTVRDHRTAILSALRAPRPAEPEAVEVDQWIAALVSLTPGDDRFKISPDECAAWVKKTFEAQDRMLTETEGREKKLKRDVAKLEEQVKSALVDSENRLADLLEARANAAAERGAPGEYMVTMDIALHVRSGVLTRRAALQPASGDARAEVERAAIRVADATLCQWAPPGDCGRDGLRCLCEAAARAALAPGQTGDGRS